MSACERPDMTNWDQIVDEHGPFVFRLARRILGPGPDAEDVVQEVFLEVFQFRKKQEVDNWAGLFHRIATHRALDRLRRRRRTDPLNMIEVSDPGMAHWIKRSRENWPNDCAMRLPNSPIARPPCFRCATSMIDRTSKLLKS